MINIKLDTIAARKHALKSKLCIWEWKCSFSGTFPAGSLVKFLENVKVSSCENAAGKSPEESRRASWQVDDCKQEHGFPQWNHYYYALPAACSTQTPQNIFGNVPVGVNRSDLDNPMLHLKGQLNFPGIFWSSCPKTAYDLTVWASKFG